MKQETLEEAEKEFDKLLNGKGLPTKQLTEVAEHYFISGYEIAKERSYSEEDLRNAFFNGWIYRGDKKYRLKFPEAKKDWFEQLKKK